MCEAHSPFSSLFGVFSLVLFRSFSRLAHFSCFSFFLFPPVFSYFPSHQGISHPPSSQCLWSGEKSLLSSLSPSFSPGVFGPALCSPSFLPPSFPGRKSRRQSAFEAGKGSKCQLGPLGTVERCFAFASCLRGVWEVTGKHECYTIPRKREEANASVVHPLSLFPWEMPGWDRKPGIHPAAKRHADREPPPTPSSFLPFLTPPLHHHQKRD